VHDAKEDAGVKKTTLNKKTKWEDKIVTDKIAREVGEKTAKKKRSRQRSALTISCRKKPQKTGGRGGT